MEPNQDDLVNQWKPLTGEYADAAVPPVEMQPPPMRVCRQRTGHHPRTTGHEMRYRSLSTSS